MCRRFDTILAYDGQTDRQTDGIAIASTALYFYIPLESSPEDKSQKGVREIKAYLILPCYPANLVCSTVKTWSFRQEGQDFNHYDKFPLLAMKRTCFGKQQDFARKLVVF